LNKLNVQATTQKDDADRLMTEAQQHSKENLLHKEKLQKQRQQVQLTLEKNEEQKSTMTRERLQMLRDRSSGLNVNSNYQRSVVLPRVSGGNMPAPLQPLSNLMSFQQQHHQQQRMPSFEVAYHNRLHPSSSSVGGFPCPSPNGASRYAPSNPGPGLFTLTRPNSNINIKQKQGFSRNVGLRHL
jgi:hypothetical protein